MANRDFIYGRQPVREVLLAGRRRLTTLYVGERARASHELEEILKLASEAEMTVSTVPRHRLEQMAGPHGNHQGVAVDAGRYSYVEWNDVVPALLEDTTSHNPLFLILDRVQDPQNLGSLMRSADAAGVALIVIPKERAAHVTPAVVRASAGASEHVQVCIVTNISNCLKALTELGVYSIGLEGGSESKDLGHVRVSGPAAVVVGSEGVGLRRLVKENCSVLARIPMHGRVNSLNAGVAGAIALYEVSKQLRAVISD
ncbi:MAG: 23S rRNA (guanosine(2251)-2'-O)-methyltransferase RlmB [Lentisphaerae bacterium]|nr:23S rRNA (guanosine(2251)-2'-O)-methyltransferase RlmB [Lentisphaerota bacterium]